VGFPVCLGVVYLLAPVNPVERGGRLRRVLIRLGLLI